MGHTNFSLIIEHTDRGTIKRLHSSQPMEAASVIKLFIVVLYIQQLQLEKLPLKHTVSVTAMEIADTELWSRRLDWSPGFFASATLINKSLVGSDAVATNTLLRELGGRKALNAKLKELGFKNTALMRDAFSGYQSRGKKYLVAKTTADDCHRLLEQVFVGRDLIKGKYLKYLRNTIGKVSLHTKYIEGFNHKTGTLLNANMLVINDIGVVYGNTFEEKPKLLLVLLTSQSFYGKYFGQLFFDKLVRFDDRIERLLKG